MNDEKRRKGKKETKKGRKKEKKMIIILELQHYLTFISKGYIGNLIIHSKHICNMFESSTKIHIANI